MTIIRRLRWAFRLIAIVGPSNIGDLLENTATTAFALAGLGRLNTHGAGFLAAASRCKVVPARSALQAVELIEIAPPTPVGFFNYFIERRSVYERAYAEAMEKFGRAPAKC